MSESSRRNPRDIKEIASRIGKSEQVIKGWFHFNHMKLSSDGILSEEQYNAVLKQFAPELLQGANTDRVPPANQSVPVQPEKSTSASSNNAQQKQAVVPTPENLTMYNPVAHREAIAQANYGETRVNISVLLSEKYKSGDSIGNKYHVISTLDNISGEADLYLCEYQGQNFMAKVYKHNEAMKEIVWTALQKVSSPYVVRAVERFTSEGRTVEILPYYKRGSLAASHPTANQIPYVVACVNEGLKALHDVGIIHKDIKPSNLIWDDNGKDVLIIDFGISSLLDENRTLKFTSTGLTLQYAAPETLHNVFSQYSDYYALGVTVYELYAGTTPYSGMTTEQIEKYYSIQNFPTPEGAPQRIKDLILGTTYFDIRNRKDSDNPNCRWRYEQVKKWCSGESQVIPGQGIGVNFGTIADYSFHGKKIQSRTELAQQLCNSWEDGKEEFFSNRLARYFDQFDPETGSDLHELMVSKEDADICFMRALHAIDHGTFAFMWKDKYYQDIKDFAYITHIELNGKNRQTISYLENAMLQHALSEHVRMVYPKRNEIAENIRQIEDYFSKQDIQRKERDTYSYVMLYRLLGKYELKIGDQTFDSIQGLTNHLLQLRLQSSVDFEQFCHELISYDDSLSSQFEAWLIALGKQNTIREWKKNITIAKG